MKNLSNSDMDAIEVATTSWRDQDAWEVTTAHLRVIVMMTGGHLAALTHRGDDLNPFWQPHWPTGKPEEAHSSDTWGAGPEAPLLTGIVGHNLCLDRFGEPWPGESRPLHGEAGISEWSSALAGDGKAFVLRCTCPEAGLQIERTLSFSGSKLQVRTAVINQQRVEKIIEWCEHATLGDPFLDGAVITAGIDKAWTMPLDAGPHKRWSELEAGVPVDRALAMPAANEPEPMGDVITSRVTGGWWKADRADLQRSLIYFWNSDEFPWLCIWSEHRSRLAKPWLGKTRARGMEISTKPFPEGKPPASRFPKYQNRLTSCIVPGDGRIEKSFTVEWK